MDDMATVDLDELVAALPADTVLTDPDMLASYRHDWARDPDAGTPLAVVRANSTEDVQAVMRWATEHRVPVVPRGAGTSLSGGSSGLEGGITLSTERMRRIAIDLLAADARRRVEHHVPERAMAARGRAQEPAVARAV